MIPTALLLTALALCAPARATPPGPSADHATSDHSHPLVTAPDARMDRPSGDDAEANEPSSEGTTRPAAPRPPPRPAPGPALERALREAPTSPLIARMDHISGAMIGARYLNDPLGESQPPDLDPLVRYDAFDCLTFVEEVLALSLTTHQPAADALRMRLRYGHSPPSYAHRHHFMELQWLPAAIDNGLLVDRTASYGPTVRHTQEVTAHTWAHWPTRARFALSDEALPLGPIHLDVLPLEIARREAKAIKPGTLLFVVREHRPGVPIWITHTGIVFHDPSGAPVLRHASRRGPNPSVRDEPLDRVLSRLGREAWPVHGVSLFEPVTSRWP